ncbi:Protein of unknown function [Bacillus mycoides]|nr:Protein of unknown function [Bacillus mycoides]
MNYLHVGVALLVTLYYRRAL